MVYSRLPFEQYFIDTSQDTNKTGNVRNVVKYKSVIFDAKHHAEYAVVFDEERNCVQVHFEKTNGDEDWNDNFNFPKQLYDTFEWEGKEIKLYVHTGWGNMYHALKHDMHVDFEEVMNEHPDAYVESIGWSLGSGEAQLGVQDLNYKYHIKPYLYTYGSVNPFWYAPNDKITKAYLESTYEVGYNISCIPGPPFGPSWVMTTTSPALTRFSSRMPSQAVSCESNTRAGPLKWKRLSSTPAVLITQPS